MAARGKSSQQIAGALREDICLNRTEADGMLHEGALAQRFGVSRTPIRQALQRLSYERMITVKSGVGSMISPLVENQRRDDLRAAVALINAVAECAPSAPLPPERLRDFAGMIGMLEISDLTRPEDLFDLRARLLVGLAELIDNPILEDAFRAAYWRLIRWRLRDLPADPAAQEQLLSTILKTTARALKSTSIAAAFGELARLEGGGTSESSASGQSPET